MRDCDVHSRGGGDNGCKEHAAWRPAQGLLDEARDFFFFPHTPHDCDGQCWIAGVLSAVVLGSVNLVATATGCAAGPLCASVAHGDGSR